MTETTTAHTPAAHHDAPHEPPRKRHWLLTAGWPRAIWMTFAFFGLGFLIVVGLRALLNYEPVVDWHVISDEGSARIFADKLLAAPRGATGYNSISNAIDFSVRLVETNAHEGTRKVIDVSGDGPNMNGRSLEQARGDALAKGFTINALAIRRPGSGRPGGPGGMSLEDYYGQSVIGGPGSFVEIADEMRPFALAARRKLLTEIAGTGGRSRHANR